MNKIEIKGLTETILTEKLDNGLEVYMLPNKNVLNYYATFSTKFGSDIDKFKVNNNVINLPHGVAHFLEHLTFHLPDGSDASLKFASLGVKSNAYTSNDVTCYEIFGFENFKEAMNNLLDMVQIPFYNNTLVKNELGIICEEIKMYEDNPASVLNINMLESLYKNLNRRFLVSGTVDDVKNTTLEDIMNAYNNFYHPSNMFVIITGNFNPEEALAIIKENQAKKEYKDKLNIKIDKKKEVIEVVNKYKEVEGNVKIDKVAVSVKIDKKKFSSLKLEETTLNIYLNIILNCLFGRTSIFKDILLRGNLVTSGPSFYKTNLKDVLVYSIISETPYKEEYLKLLNEVLDTMEVREEDFNRRKKCLISNIIQSFDDIEEVNYSIMLDLLNYGHIINDDIEVINKLSFETMKKIAKILVSDNRSTVILKAKEK